MTISYPLSLPNSPTPGLRKITLAARSALARTEGPYDFSQQLVDWGGERWEASIEFPAMKRAKAEPILAFLLAAKGGTIKIGPFDGASINPQGVATGTPLVNGTVAARSKTITTKGWTHSIPGILKAGDYIQVTDSVQIRLHKVLTDANSDSSGNATLDVWPRVRAALADGNAIAVSNPQGIFQLAAPDIAWTVDYQHMYGDETSAQQAGYAAGKSGLGFAAVEVI